MTLQTKTRPRRARLAFMLAIPAITLAACSTSPNDARWHGSIAVTQPPGPHHAHAHAAAPVLPGAMASSGNRFWDARRDAEFGHAASGPATAGTEWPAPPRPNEQIFRFRTLQRN